MQFSYSSFVKIQLPVPASTIITYSIFFSIPNTFSSENFSCVTKDSIFYGLLEPVGLQGLPLRSFYTS